MGGGDADAATRALVAAARRVDNLWHEGRQEEAANRALCDALDRYWLTPARPRRDLAVPGLVLLALAAGLVAGTIVEVVSRWP
jgi:hypothetical protein